MLFYADAVAVPSRSYRGAASHVMHDPRGKTEDGKAKPTVLHSGSGMAKLVQRLRQVAKLSQTFSLDACRDGGMTALEEAELTDGQGRALSAHTSTAYERCARRIMVSARRDQEAPRAPTGNSQCERQGNRISERAAERVSE